MSEAYVGPDRRAAEHNGCSPDHPKCDDHLHRIVNDKMHACKSELSQDIHLIREDISKIEAKQDALTTDVHKLSVSVRDIATNSASIAESLNSMNGMFDTYKSLVGVNKVFAWVRENIITVALIVAIFLWLSGKLDLKVLLGWLI